MGERLAGGNVAIALLANTLATGAALVTLILTFGSVSGRALQSRGVALRMRHKGGLSWTEAGAYVISQTVGAFAGVAVAGRDVWRAALRLVAARFARAGRRS